jgi:pyruvate dehydrogenase E2 component (dihydrolipoamide acetyltransferase)
VAGSGPNGRILEADVIAAAGAAYGRTSEVQETPASAAREVAPAAQATPPAFQAAPQNVEKDVKQVEPAVSDKPYTDEAFTKIRSVIAKTMMGSLHRSAQLTHHHSFDATNILAMREDFKNSDEELGYRGVSVGDIILYVSARVLARHPEINALVAEEGVRRYHTVNLGVAVDTPRGLLVPTIFGADTKSLKEISGELKALAAAAKEGRISPDRLSGGTFTISNLGATGVEMFTPIINPPQAAIAGICGVVERVRRGRRGRPEVYPSIGVSLTYDHRAVDGAPASRFAAELCEALTNFSWKTLALEIEREVSRYGR